MPTPSLLQVEDVTVAVAGAPILEGVSLSLEPGDRLGLTGPSGLGKTSLLRVIAGLDPISGTVRLRGQAPEDLGWPAYRRRVVLISQRPVLLDATVRENLSRPFHYRLNHGAFPEDRARALLDQLGVELERLDQPARSLSEGQQQRVCLVRAMLLEPAVLLLDEPTSALDAANVEAVERAVEAYVAEGHRAALLVSHDAAQTERWCTATTSLDPYRSKGFAHA